MSTLTSDFITISSSSVAMDAWLKEVSHWLERQLPSAFSMELLALLLSGLFIRAIKTAACSEATISLITKSFCELAKVYPTIVSKLCLNMQEYKAIFVHTVSILSAIISIPHSTDSTTILPSGTALLPSLSCHSPIGSRSHCKYYSDTRRKLFTYFNLTVHLGEVMGKI